MKTCARTTRATRAYQDGGAVVDMRVSAADDACAVLRFLGAEIESALADCAREEGFVVKAPRGRPLPEVPASLAIGMEDIPDMRSRSPVAIARAVACVAAGMVGGAEA